MKYTLKSSHLTSATVFVHALIWFIIQCKVLFDTRLNYKLIHPGPTKYIYDLVPIVSQYNKEKHNMKHLTNYCKFT